MTNFIYNMQDELFHLNMILPVGEFSPIMKLVDHIEAQGKQLRELNAAIAKKNKTIEKYEREKKDLQERNSYLYKKVVELNNGIRDSEDLTWKQKYDALLHSSEQAIVALQKKCQEYKNSESEAITSTIETLVRENKELEEKNKFIEKRCREAEKALEDEKQVNKNFNTIINNKNKLLDEYMTKYNNLESNYNEEARMNMQLKTTCFRYEVEAKKLKYDNCILRGRTKEICDLAKTISELCEDEE